MNVTNIRIKKKTNFWKQLDELIKQQKDFTLSFYRTLGTDKIWALFEIIKSCSNIRAIDGILFTKQLKLLELPKSLLSVKIQIIDSLWLSKCLHFLTSVYHSHVTTLYLKCNSYGSYVELIGRNEESLVEEAKSILWSNMRLKNCEIKIPRLGEILQCELLCQRNTKYQNLIISAVCLSFSILKNRLGKDVATIILKPLWKSRYEKETYIHFQHQLPKYFSEGSLSAF
jgi:hypothetical protein